MERTISERGLLEASNADQDLSPVGAGNGNEFIPSVSADVAALQQQQQQQYQQQQQQLQQQYQQQQLQLQQQQLQLQQQQQYLQPPSYSPPPPSVQYQTPSSQTNQPGYQMTLTPAVGQLQPDFQVCEPLMIILVYL